MLLVAKSAAHAAEPDGFCPIEVPVSTENRSSPRNAQGHVSGEVKIAIVNASRSSTRCPAELARDFGVKRATILRVLARAGITPNPAVRSKKRPLIDAIKEEILELYDNDIGPKEIASQLGLTLWDVRSFLAAEGTLDEPLDPEVVKKWGLLHLADLRREYPNRDYSGRPWGVTA